MPFKWEYIPNYSFNFDVIYLLSLIWFIGISSFDGDYLLRFWESIESWPALLNENFWIEFEVSNKGIDYILWKQFDSTRKIYSNVLWWSMIRNFHFDLIFVRFKTLRKKKSNCQENTSDWAHCKTRIFSWIQKNVNQNWDAAEFIMKHRLFECPNNIYSKRNFGTAKKMMEKSKTTTITQP